MQLTEHSAQWLASSLAHLSVGTIPSIKTRVLNCHKHHCLETFSTTGMHDYVRDHYIWLLANQLGPWACSHYQSFQMLHWFALYNAILWL